MSRLGPAGLSMEAVAREAGCSRSTLYRRGLTIDDLVLRAAASLIFRVEEGGPDQLRMSAFARTSILANRDSLAGVMMLSSEAVRGTELGRRYLAEVFEPLRERRRELLEMAMDRGELAADTDLDLLMDLLAGGLLFRATHAEIETDLSDRITSMLMRGVSPDPRQ